MMVLAEQVGRSTEYTGWYVGLTIGFVIVSVVVVLVATILTLVCRYRESGADRHRGHGGSPRGHGLGLGDSEDQRFDYCHLEGCRVRPGSCWEARCSC